VAEWNRMTMQDRQKSYAKNPKKQKELESCNQNHSRTSCFGCRMSGTFDICNHAFTWVKKQNGDVLLFWLLRPYVLLLILTLFVLTGRLTLSLLKIFTTFKRTNITSKIQKYNTVYLYNITRLKQLQERKSQRKI